MVAAKNSIVLDKPDLFVPAVRRDQAEGQGLVTTSEEVVDTNIESTASFRYDPPGVGLRSTQQIDIEWSRFENHTFFNSAEVNVNVAFERIINEFPFDGTKRELEAFFDRLTGFERRHVYENFPKNKGFLFFSGTIGVGDGGTVVEVEDFAGSAAPTLAKDPSGKSILSPGLDPFTIEMQLFLPAESNDRTIIAQKLSGSDQGITLALSEDPGGVDGELFFSVVSASVQLNASASVPKGQFNHIVASFDQRVGQNDLKIFVNEKLLGQSEVKKTFRPLDFAAARFTIGSGSNFVTASAGALFDQQQTLSGAIDEFRVFHGVRTTVQQECFARKAIFPTSALKLYFKFNEPTGTIGTTTTEKINRIVLDSSGNALHGFIHEAGFDFELRNTSSLAVPMIHEKLDLSPVLFPQHTDVQAFNSTLLVSATSYDQNNPNLITRLVPKHYFEEGQAVQGLDSVGGTIGTGLEGGASPGEAELGSAQLFATVLFTWAKFFDELKIMVDAFNRVLTVGYDPTNTTPDQFLPLVAEYFGFKLPGFFSDAGIAQFIDAEDIDHSISTNEVSLRFVQNQILRRILTSLRDIISSKGTIHGVKAFFRAMGIDPDNSVRIREFGGPTRSTLAGLREKKTDVSTMLNMSASLAFLESPFLTASKIEPAESFPPSTAPHVETTIEVPVLGGGTINKLVFASPAVTDGCLTSGSFTYEAVYKFPLRQILTDATQSLVRFHVSGVFGDSSASLDSLLANVIATSGTFADEPAIRFYTLPGELDTNTIEPPPLILELTGANIFDGNKWHVSWGRFRNDDPKLKIERSSSYFLRAERRDVGEVQELFETQSFFAPSAGSFFEAWNRGGSGELFVFSPQFRIGTQSIDTNPRLLSSTLTDLRFLNNPSSSVDEARVTFFDGKVGHIRFWSKGLSGQEMSEHARNFKSLGVDDAAVNFNFVDNTSGSFGRLRIDATTDQSNEDRDADALGNIRIFDFSQNELHLTGTTFESGSKPIEVETFTVDQLSTVIDEASTTEKVRVRSFQSFANVQDHPVSALTPVYEILRSEMPQDDVRFSIDFSVADALNRDIIRMLAALDEFDKALGDPANLFSPDYPRLEGLRDVYFNRLSDKVNVRSFQDFFKWIDISVGLFVQQLIPRKTRFLGMNFVIENHLLERPRLEYKYTDTYMGEEQLFDRGVILLQQFVGVLRKY